MSTGTYSRLMLANGVNTVLVPSLDANKTSVVTVNFCNTSANVAVIRLAITSNVSNTQAGATVNPASNGSEYIEFNTSIGPSGVLERTGIVIQSGLQIVGWANTSNVVTAAYGMES